ncbi:hypothetical protein SDC9_01675 [bioreactor metagenome]|uniref:Uncharacterized protein n=1 Tax=bioreactor metagenome TaxID=1076179 RepID=A0A644SNI5_9ZZZZ
MKLTVYIFVLILFYSCNDGSNLGNNYYYLPDYESKDIGYPYGTIVYKSKEKNHFDKILVYSDVEKVKLNNNFIIVFQRPNKKFMLKKIEDDLNTWNYYYSENKKDSIVDIAYSKISLKDIYDLSQKRKLADVADSIVRKERFYLDIFSNAKNYYIINKNNNKVFGPLQQKDFENLKLKFNIDL